MNKPSPRRRRNKSPELSEITGLIDDARKLRLTLDALTNYPLLSDPTRAAVASLAQVTGQLEQVADLVASAKRLGRKRRSQDPVPSPTEPSHEARG